MLWIFYILPLVYCQQVFNFNTDLHDYYVNGQSMLEFHKNLVDIPSVKPSELAVAQYIEQFLSSNGLTVELHKAAENRYNVYAFAGDERNSKILLTSHIDTVPPFFPYSIDGSRIYGRGSCDAKASVATQVFTYLSMLQSGDVVPGDVSLLFVVGEETDGVGMKSVGHSYNASWEIGIFGEPTELKLGVGHKGILMCYVNVEGEASHSGYPELGISATEILLPVLNDFLTSDWPVDELLGPTTLNIAQISAGVAANVIPPFANASIFFRVSSDLEALDKKVRSKLDGIEHLSYDIPFESAPVYLDYEVPGFESIILAYATDIPNLYHHNLTRRYLYGPGTIHVAHSDHEYVESKDLVDAVDGYKKLIKYNLEY